MSLRASLRSAITIALGFVREHTPESSTRLAMLLFAATASLIGLAAAVYAFIRNEQYHALELLRAQAVAFGKPVDTLLPDTGVTMVTALGGVASLFIGSGAVAIALRTRKGKGPPDPSSAASAPAGSGETAP